MNNELDKKNKLSNGEMSLRGSSNEVIGIYSTGTFARFLSNFKNS